MKLLFKKTVPLLLIVYCLLPELAGASQESFVVLSPLEQKVTLHEGSVVPIVVSIPPDVAALVHVFKSNGTVPETYEKLRHECPFDIHLKNQKSGVLYDAYAFSACYSATSVGANNVHVRVKITFRPIKDGMHEPFPINIVPGKYVVRVSLSREWAQAFPRYAAVESDRAFTVVEDKQGPSMFKLQPLSTDVFTAGEVMNIRWKSLLPGNSHVTLTLYKAGTGTRYRYDYICNIASVENNGAHKRLLARDGGFSWRIPKIGDSAHGLTDITHCIEFGDEPGMYQFLASATTPCAPGNKSCTYGTVTDMSPVFTIK